GLAARAPHAAKAAASVILNRKVNGLRHYSRSFPARDAGDVIGIDLGTTNSCVAIMEVS
ncbi:unnamed protein product, partial [Heterosigma akashiwo]